MTLLLGCIADDFTGATDLANTLVKAGMRTIQLLAVPADELAVPDAASEHTLLSAHGGHVAVVPDLARPSGPPVQLEGAGGPLSQEQSKAILDRLASSGKDTDIFDRHLALEEAIVGSPLTTAV